MPKAPEISVIVPVHTAQNTLRRCVDSVLCQAVDLECILAENASTDASGAICDEYAARDSRVIALHRTQSGVSRARNDGLAAARGRYICFLDSDDYLLPGALETALRAQQTYPERWVLWHYDIGDGEPFGTETELRPADALGRLYIDCLIAMPWNKLYRADIAKQLSFDTSLSLGEDLKYCLDYHKAAGKPDFAVLERPLTYYDCTESTDGRLSTRYHANYCDLWLELFGRLRADCAALGTGQEVLRTLAQMELRVVAEGVADLQRRAPQPKAVRRRRGRALLADARVRQLLRDMKQERCYSPYYLPVRMGSLALLCRMADWKADGSPWYGRMDWLGWYLLGGGWKRI